MPHNILKGVIILLFLVGNGRLVAAAAAAAGRGAESGSGSGKFHRCTLPYVGV